MRSEASLYLNSTALELIMPRIVYGLEGLSTNRGGHKVSLRHVEALRKTGFDAFVCLFDDSRLPHWFEHSVPLISFESLVEDDFLVIGEHSSSLLRRISLINVRKTIFCQNHIYMAAFGMAGLTLSELDHYDEYIACSNTVALWLLEMLPKAKVGIIPAFADERFFFPRAKESRIVSVPWKRNTEYHAVMTMVKRMYRGDTSWSISSIHGQTEEQIAETFGISSIFLSMNRLEGLGMTTLEAMASGCVAVGFSGGGGKEYISPINGLWSEEDDCEMCAHQLLKAMKMISDRDKRIDLMIEAARRTASLYSYSKFLEEIRAYWTARLAKPHR